MSLTFESYSASQVQDQEAIRWHVFSLISPKQVICFDFLWEERSKRYFPPPAVGEGRVRFLQRRTRCPQYKSLNLLPLQERRGPAILAGKDGEQFPDTLERLGASARTIWCATFAWRCAKMIQFSELFTLPHN